MSRVNTTRLVVGIPDTSNYARQDFVDENGDLMLAWSCHRVSNPALHDESGEWREYRHNHATFYSTDSNGRASHVIDITHTTDSPQVQLNVPMICKGKNAAIVIRSDDGRKFMRLRYSDERGLYCDEMPRSEIEYANDEWDVVPAP